MSETLFVGLDVGGSSTTMLASAASSKWDEKIYSVDGPGANLKRVGLEQCVRTISGLIHDACTKLSGERILVCAGIAGASTSDEKARLQEAIVQQTGATVEIVPDARLALDAAFPGDSGLVVIAGTGSIIYGRSTSQEYVRAGGWGGIIGDEASGYNLAISGLRALTHAIDGGPDTMLSKSFAERGISTRKDVLQQVYAEEARPQDLASIVLTCAENNDEIAAGILIEQVAALADQALWASNRLDNISPRICGFGGMMNHTMYRETLRSALESCLPEWSLRFSSESPARGALYLASQLTE